MRKHLHFPITCLCLILAISLSAQQGNIAAGGDATGAGGSMSYSIGQTDYLMYSSDQGSLSFGLQQTWQISEEPPLTLEISDMVISAGEALCFNAVETITVAGYGDQFIVQANGHADLIAGHSIHLKHGTSVELYGSLHARISNIFCPPQQSLLASFYEEPKPIRQSFEPIQNSGFFKVYPNPTTGDFTLELLKVEEASLLLLEIYTMQGNLLLWKELPAERLNNLSIAGRQAGIYLVKVMNKNQVGTVKIIKQ
jgi:hypothetical protein